MVAQHEKSRPVWDAWHGQDDPRRAAAGGEETNVCGLERTASLVGGLGLIGWGLSRRSLPGLLLAGLGGALAWRGYSGRCAVYKSLGIDTAHREARPRDYFERGVHVEEAITIAMPKDEVYRFWRRFDNLPKFMNHLESVQVIDDTRSRWRAKAPAGQSVEWEAEIINEEEGSLIAWRSLPGADVDNTGSVRFREAPGGRGVEIRVTIEYLPPAGTLGSWVAWAFGEEPSVQIADDLRRLKQLLETGEIPTTKGQSSGRGVDGRVPGDTRVPVTGATSPRGRGDSPDDTVAEASEESFPASDAPGWTGSRG